MSSAAAAAASAPPSASSTALQAVPYLQSYEGAIANDVNVVLVSLDHFFLSIAESAIVFLIIAGVLVYFTRVNERLGKKFIEGGLMLAIFLAFVAPYLAAAYC